MPNNRRLAFYKADGKPWTKEEYYKILDYVGEPLSFFNEDRATFKYIYDDGDDSEFMHFWIDQTPHNCTEISYESVFKRKILNKEIKWVKLKETKISKNLIKKK